MKKTIEQHAKDALLVQDACNLSGVVHSLAVVVSDIREYANTIGKGTEYVNTHPIVQAYVDKLASLARVQGSSEIVFRAFAECEKLCETNT